MLSRFLFRFYVAAIAGTFFSACGGGSGEKPMAADIEQSIRSSWEKAGDNLSPRATVEIHSIKIGSGARANEQDKVDGAPPDAWVTIALVDFTVRTHYSNSTQAVRRVRECKVFRDQFDDWRAMLGSRHGEDKTTIEPSVP